jgi:hypothetical protein
MFNLMFGHLKFHDLETLSSTHYKQFKIEPSGKKKQWQPSSGIVKASCCVNFSHQKNYQH